MSQINVSRIKLNKYEPYILGRAATTCMEHDKKTEFKRLLSRYLEGSETPEEYESFLEFLESGELYEADDEIMRMLEQLEDHEDYRPSFDRVYARLLKSIRRQRSTRWLMAAAVSLVLLASVALLWINQQKHAALPLVTGPTAKPIQVFRDKRIVHLPDGSTAFLNEGSELQYGADFDSLTREVILVGEAYFDVAHNADRPFIVKTGNTTTTVLGTAFNVKSTDDKVEVVVTRGKVKVADNHGHAALIIPNERITVRDTEQEFTKEVVQAERSVAWAEEFVVFQNATLKDAVARLEAHFEVTIKLVNPTLENCVIAGSFFSDDTLDNILEVVCKVVDCNYTKQPGGHIVIDGHGC